MMIMDMNYYVMMLTKCYAQLQNLQLSLRRLFDEAVLESTSVHWSLEPEAWELGGMTLKSYREVIDYN
jgi:hypothetical protein